MAYLILTRRKDQRVRIVTPEGRTITVMVARVRGHEVKLAFAAERDINIVREECVSTPDADGAA